MSKDDLKQLVEKLCDSIMNKASVEDILKNLIEGLQLEPVQEEQIVVKNVAEILHSIEEVKVLT